MSTPPELVRGLSGQPRPLDVQLADDRLEPVVGLADRGRGERVRGGDVGTGLEVGPVHGEHDVGPREVEEVGVAGDVARMVAEALACIVFGCEPLLLEHRPPRTVEDEDPLVEELPDLLRRSRRCYRHRVPPCLSETGRGGRASAL